MSQIDQFLEAFKRALKEKNILYRDLAKSMHLSESTIKRILSNKSISLERIEQICRAADLSFQEILKEVVLNPKDEMMFFTEKQETALAADLRMFHFYILLCDGHSTKEIEEHYHLSPTEIRKFIFQLDHLNLIELHPSDRIKVKSKAQLRFRREGSVGSILLKQIKAEYLNYDFSEKDYIRFVVLRITPETLAKYQVKLEKMIVEMQEEAQAQAQVQSQTQMQTQSQSQSLSQSHSQNQSQFQVQLQNQPRTEESQIPSNKFAASQKTDPSEFAKRTCNVNRNQNAILKINEKLNNANEGPARNAGEEMGILFAFRPWQYAFMQAIKGKDSQKSKEPAKSSSLEIVSTISKT